MINERFVELRVGAHLAYGLLTAQHHTIVAAIIVRGIDSVRHAVVDATLELDVLEALFLTALKLNNFVLDPVLEHFLLVDVHKFGTKLLTYLIGGGVDERTWEDSAMDHVHI